jgi:hypothetical protein
VTTFGKLKPVGSQLIQHQQDEPDLRFFSNDFSKRFNLRCNEPLQRTERYFRKMKKTASMENRLYFAI